MNISVELTVKKVFPFVCLVGWLILSYSDFRSSKTDAQQLIKHLSLCPDQQSFRDLKQNESELFLSFMQGHSWAAVLEVNVNETTAKFQSIQSIL